MREWADLTIKVSYKLPATGELPSGVAGPAACIGSRVDKMWRNGIVVCVDATGAYNLTGQRNAGPSCANCRLRPFVELHTTNSVPHITACPGPATVKFCACLCLLGA